MKKYKKIVKYVINALNIINALVVGLNAIEGIQIPYAIQITQIIALITGIISTYLTGSKKGGN